MVGQDNMEESDEDQLLVSIPNAFSPDSDGVNDQWQVLLSNESLSRYSTEVYNRQGHVIWQSSDPKDKWNGRGGRISEHHAADGVYIYRVVCQEFGKSDIIELTGTVTLLR